MIEYTDAELDEFEELGEIIESMSPEELKDFMESVEILGKAKKSGNFVTDDTVYLH
jgi:hypothetical protein